MSSLAILFVLTSFNYNEDFYSFSLKDIEGKAINLNSYKGKKVLIMIIPLNENGMATINELGGFKTKFGDKIKIIGIPSIEEGYKNGDESILKKLYTLDRNIDIVITEGVKVMKTGNQSELFKWLTDNKKNGHFKQDVKGVGHKFFVNEKGKLYAVLSPRASLSATVIDRIVNQQAEN